MNGPSTLQVNAMPEQVPRYGPDVAQAGFIGDASRPCFAWLHRPASANGVGLVIVPPFGFEAVCAHRSMRHLAEQAAQAGITVVRVDLDGTGDSAGDDRDSARWNAWLSSIDDACALLRESGARHLVLAGIRLGATLAMQAALRRNDIDGLVAIAVAANGKAYLREARLLQMALDLAPAPASTVADGNPEIAGFAITEETRAAIAAIDLMAMHARPAPAILLIDRDDFPAQDELASHLRTLGAAVEQQSLPGFVEMMLDPHRSSVAERIIDASVAFIESIAAPAFPDAEPGPVIAFPTGARVEQAGCVVVEEAINLDRYLFGVVSKPQSGNTGRAVILLNAGAVGRIGPNRMHVTLARRLAARGDLALRLDLSGMGDSPPRPGADENVVYSEHSVADVGVAVAWARTQGATEVVVVGLCSGAYHACRAALVGPGIDQVVMINPLTFYYLPGMPLELSAFRVTAEARRYGTSARSAASWRKLLRGEVRVGRVAGILARRVHDKVQHRFRDLLRRSGKRLDNDLGSDLLTLAQRGTSIGFIFSASDPGHAMLMEQGGAVVGTLMEHGDLTLRIIEGADHTFTPLWSQPVLIEMILQIIPGLVGV
ncbi:MAG: alpha/beta fold hydrolase [Pseudoxanthomonas sp.]